MTNWDQDCYAKAWRFAAICHQGQSYGGIVEGEQINYLVHLGNVAMEVIWALQHEPVGQVNGNLALQCALLHDSLEDTSTTHAILVQQFGLAVADGVQALSKDATLPNKAEKMADSLRRIQLQPREVGMVKLADRINNLEHPPFYWDNAKILAYRDEAALILQELGHCSEVLATRLAKKIADYPNFLRS